jgi:DNA-directed RNA polymerase subunit F
MKKVNLDYILEQALEQALAALAGKAAAMVEQALEQALLARVQALLEDGGLTPANEAPTRARARAAMVEATLAQEAKEEEAKPRKRKAKATPIPTPIPTSEDDLATILEAAKVALGKYSGASTPRGKPLSEVLYRRVRKALEHAQSLGRTDIPALARSALAYIAADPRAVAMSSWQYLAGKLGLPVPVAQGE